MVELPLDLQDIINSIDPEIRDLFSDECKEKGIKNQNLLLILYAMTLHNKKKIRGRKEDSELSKQFVGIIDALEGGAE